MPRQIGSRHVINFFLRDARLRAQDFHILHPRVGMRHVRKKLLVPLVEQQALRPFEDWIGALAYAERLHAVVALNARYALASNDPEPIMFSFCVWLCGL